MQYYVPQFIEMESKVIGPLTLKQFLFIAAPCVIIIVLFFLLKSVFIVIFFGLLLGGVGVAFAFLKHEGQSIPNLSLYMFSYFLSPRQYIWFKKSEQKFTIKDVKVAIKEKEKTVFRKVDEGSKLKKLSWSIQTKK